MRGIRPIAAAVVLLGVVAGGVLLLRREPALPPNVVLLTVDTLRADHLGAYGAAGDPTPNIDRLASEGTLFENAACPMPMTRPSLSAIHSGQHPRTSGVVNNAVDLPGEVVTLAEAMRDAGYVTAGMVGVRLLDDDSGFAQGFYYYAAPNERPQIRGAKVLRRALDWLNGRNKTKPFFLWIHLFDPHLPYAPPKSFARAGKDEADATVDKVGWRTFRTAAQANGGDVPRALLERSLELYAAEVAYVDRVVGELVEGLEKRGVLDGTLIAFTADHGECFGHGVFFEHADCLYEGAVHVPLFFRMPGRVPAGARATGQVRHTDVAATILALVDVPRPESFEGRALLPATGDRGEVFALIQHPLYDERAVLGRGSKQDVIRSVAGEPLRPILVDQPSEALRGVRWKLIATGEARELYDLPDDPGEERDLAASRPRELGEMETRLQEELAHLPLAERAPSAINPKLRETLRALGYAD